MNKAKQNILNKQTAFILLVGDSLTGELEFQYPQRIAELMAIRYPDANVLLEKRSIDQSAPCPAASTIIHTGNANYSIKIIRDGVPGTTTLATTSPARLSRIFCETTHLTCFALGTNDALQNYPCADYVNNLHFLGNTARQVHGSDVFLMTPSWYGADLNPLIPGYAEMTELVGYRGGFPVINLSRNFLRNHQAGNGHFGQGDRYASSEDSIHYARAGHYAAADEFMRVFDL